MKYKLLIIVILFLSLIVLSGYLQKTNGNTGPIGQNINNKTEIAYLDINTAPLSYIKSEYIKDKDFAISTPCKKEPNRYYYNCSFTLQNTDFFLNVDRICSYYETYSLKTDVDKITIRDIIKPEYLDTAYNNSIRITNTYYSNTNPPMNETVFRIFSDTENEFTIIERHGIWFPGDTRPIYYTMSDTDIQIKNSAIEIMYKLTYLQC